MAVPDFLAVRLPAFDVGKRGHPFEGEFGRAGDLGFVVVRMVNAVFCHG